MRVQTHLIQETKNPSSIRYKTQLDAIVENGLN